LEEDRNPEKGVGNIFRKNGRSDGLKQRAWELSIFTNSKGGDSKETRANA